MIITLKSVKILNDENIKDFHFSRADLAHIKYYLKTETNNVLDTKIASSLQDLIRITIH